MAKHTKFPGNVLLVVFCIAVAAACLIWWGLSGVSSEQTVLPEGALPGIAPAKDAAASPKAEPPADAPFDGWESEAFSAVSGKQLKAIGHFLEHPSPETESEVRGAVAEDVRFDPLRPTGLTTVYDDAVLKVTRQSEGGETVEPHSGIDRFFEMLRELRAPFSQMTGLRFYPKMIDVQLDRPPGGVTTVQYVSLSGYLDGGSLEQHSTWTVEWTKGSGSTPPRATRIQVRAFEESRIVSGPAMFFSDCTESAFGGDNAYRNQLCYGVPYWRHRIEGYHHFYQFGYNGLAVGDINGDGLEDLYCCQPGGLPNRLYLHQADGTVREASAPSGVDYLDNTRSALLLDLDNDGDQDLVLALTSRLLFLENDGSGRMTDRVFVRVREAFSLAAADYDNDGDLDIYACVYHGKSGAVGEIPMPLPQYDANNGGDNYLIRNDGGWQFADVTAETGLHVNNQRYSFAAAWEDFDDDGDLDLYVANDFGRNNLYRQDGGRFADIAAQAQVEDSASGMSVSMGDYDRDGKMDLYVGNMFSSAGHRVTSQPKFMPDATAEEKAHFRYLARGNSLFRNAGNGQLFEDVSEEAGVTVGRWSWSSLFGDINNDGWEDLLVANGFVTGVGTEDL